MVADEGDWVQVIHNGHPAWLRKADVVRAADAIEHFTKLIQSDPTNLSWPLYRGSAYREIGKYDEGIKDYDTLIAKSPTVFTYWNNRASIKITARRYASAIEDLNKAAELSPDAAIVYRNRGHARFLSKEYDTAIADCNRAIELEPTSAAPVTYRGQCREKQGEYATAAKDFVAALNLEPLNAYSLNARAWFLATVPDAAMQDAALALKLIEQARELSDWKSGSYLDTLAAVLAANGRFEEAVRCQEDALRDKKFTEDKGEEAKARLELYRQKKPYRQKENAYYSRSQALLGNARSRSSASPASYGRERTAFRWEQRREAELRTVRSQAELGNENNCVTLLRGGGCRRASRRGGACWWGRSGRRRGRPRGGLARWPAPARPAPARRGRPRRSRAAGGRSARSRRSAAARRSAGRRLRSPSTFSTCRCRPNTSSFSRAFAAASIRSTRSPNCRSSGAGLHQHQLAADEVDAGVAFRCPDAQPPLRPLADPAGGDVGDAAVREDEPGVHHVLVPAEHRRPDRVDGLAPARRPARAAGPGRGSSGRARPRCPCCGR